METLRDLATNPVHTKWMYPLLLIADAALCGLIIEFVPCKCSRDKTSNTCTLYDIYHTNPPYPTQTQKSTGKRTWSR